MLEYQRPVRGLPIGPGASTKTDPTGCPCGTHSQHQLLRLYYSHQGITRRGAAEDLHWPYERTKKAWQRLWRRPDSHLLCPECFTPSLRALVCTNCGVELARPDLPLEVTFDSQSPVHSIQPLNGLGSATDYRGLKLQYGHANVKHLVERAELSTLEAAKSQLWEELKSFMPPDFMVEEGSRLLTRGFCEFRARYPALLRLKGLKDQLVANTMALLRFRYPQLRHGDKGTPVMASAHGNSPPKCPITCDGSVQQ